MCKLKPQMPKRFSIPEIESDVLEIIGFHESRLNLKDVNTFSNFQDDLGADDTTLLDILLEVADKFNIGIDALTNASISTVGDLINVVASEIGRG